MSVFERLSKGIVDWHGQRLFVPWIGAPRMVPATADETQLVRLRSVLDLFIGLMLVLYFVVAWSHDDAGRVAASEMLMGAVLGAFGIVAFLERRLTEQWSHQTTAHFGRSRFMLRYFRSRSLFDRIYELGCGAVVLAITGYAFRSDFLTRVEPWDSWPVAILNSAVLGVMTFFSGRHAVLALLSLVPVPHKRQVSGSSHGA